ncbi:MAG TPA: hypothetical protein VLD37_00865 [Candidatus Bilamarchaeum sp.]|nr:hypothetical protein [Candidatus Bilamarchaeum sp.]
MRLLFIAIAALLLLGCAAEAMKIDKLLSEPEKYLGEKVTLRGTVEDSVKLGDLSGFTLDDGTGKIFVSSETLPPEGKTATVSGTLMKQQIFLSTRYYVLAKDLNWN